MLGSRSAAAAAEFLTLNVTKQLTTIHGHLMIFLPSSLLPSFVSSFALSFLPSSRTPLPPFLPSFLPPRCCPTFWTWHVIFAVVAFFKYIFVSIKKQVVFTVHINISCLQAVPAGTQFLHNCEHLGVLFSIRLHDPHLCVQRCCIGWFGLHRLPQVCGYPLGVVTVAEYWKFTTHYPI